MPYNETPYERTDMLDKAKNFYAKHTDEIRTGATFGAGGLFGIALMKNAYRGVRVVDAHFLQAEGGARYLVCMLSNGTIRTLVRTAVAK